MEKAWKPILLSFCTIVCATLPLWPEEQYPTRTQQVLQTILNTAPSGIGIVENRIFTEVNDYIIGLTGYSRTELIGKSARMLYPAQEDYDFVGEEKYRQIREKGTGCVETRWQHKDGSIIHVILSSTPLDPDNHEAGITFTAQDITSRKLAEDTLARRTRWFVSISLLFVLILLAITIFLVVALLQRRKAQLEALRQLYEKELLLKEIHHRVKNNVANIEGLLSLQLSTFDAEHQAAPALQESITRVQSMRVLYDRLLMEESYDSVSMLEYAGSLVDSFADVFTVGSTIEIAKDIQDFAVPAKKAFCMGIIINELLTNSVKYAFRGRQEGKIIVGISNNDGFVELVVSDNGIGLKGSSCSKDGSDIGLSIVAMLADQLDGTYTLDGTTGTRCVVQFKL